MADSACRTGSSEVDGDGSHRRWRRHVSTRGLLAHHHYHHHNLLLLLLPLLMLGQPQHVSLCEAYTLADFLAAFNDPAVSYHEVRGDIALTSSLPPLERSLTLVGKGPKKNSQPVIVDGGSKYRGIDADSNVTLINLEFRNFFTTDEGAVLRASGDWVVIERCVFRNNKARTGGAVYLYSTTYKIGRSQFIGNEATSVAGALWSMSDGTGTIRHCRFESNSAGSSGGALGFKQQIGGKIESSVFRKNRATEEGGAIWFSRGDDQVSGCRFEDNVAGSFGGAFRFFGDDEGWFTVCRGNRYSGNKANPPTSNNLYISASDNAHTCDPWPPATLIVGNVTNSCQGC